MPTITFIDTSNDVPQEYYPRPAKFLIPEWLKNLMPYDGGKYQVTNPATGAKTNQTAKRCVPVMDAVITGYTIPLPNDLSITTDQNGELFFQWPNGLGVEFHPKFQYSTHSDSRHSLPKLISPWAIKTPKNYSTLLLAPLNQDNPPISAFSGVVDTDSYLLPINFPFYVKPGLNGVIAAGTPFIQAIPFKRESWKMQIERGETEAQKKQLSLLSRSFKGGYRNLLWARKEYN